MTKLLPFKLIIALLHILLLTSCENNNNEDLDNSPSPWNNRFYDGQHTINNTSFYTSEIQGAISNTDVDTYCCETELPNETFSIITLRIYIPKHPNPNFSSGLRTKEQNRIIVGYGNNLQTEDVFQSGSIKFIGTIDDPFDSALKLSGFEIKATISNSYGINKLNFKFLNFPFYLIYVDDNGNEFFKSQRTFTLLNSNC